MPSPNPSDKQEYAFWCREKAAADIKKADITSSELSKKLGMTAEQTYDYLAMLEAH